MRPAGRIFSACIYLGLWSGSRECMGKMRSFFMHGDSAAVPRARKIRTMSYAGNGGACTRIMSAFAAVICVALSVVCTAEQEEGNMANERITEGIVRDHFKADPHFQSIKWDEQKTANKRISDLLKGQSKGGGKGDGRPEFIVSFPMNSNYLIVVECKADPSKHRSHSGDNAKDYAVDGVLHYAKALSKEFSVIAVAVSGEKESELLVSHFYWKKGAAVQTELPDEKLLAIGSYLQVFDDQFFLSDFYFRDIAAKARELNETLYQYSIKELSRCTLVSAVLLALKDRRFVDEYATKPTIQDLGSAIITAIDATFKAEEAENENDMVRNASLLIKEFQGILKEPLFTQLELPYDKGKKKESTLVIVKDLINELQTKVYPLVEHANVGYDVIGLFYTEFIRYAGSEQKLGLVLTPGHVTDLFCDLAELRENDVVYDPCCGTGGFIVAAIERLFKIVGNDQAKRRHVKRKQICGCELRSDMYTYACSNMRFRGDGKSNLYNGDCFAHEAIIRVNHKPSVAFLNPPYGKTVSSARQMEFVEHALKSLDPSADGRVVAIVQMSCAIKNEKELLTVKERILKHHHLKAVISMPDDLFYPVGVVTCVMVFEANKPNAGRKTWFGYFKDDGFEKRKGLGRIDVRNRYATLKDNLLKAYRNLEEVPGLSVRREVDAKDEWCAEAYMETDYSTLSDLHFIVKLREYAAYKVAHSNPCDHFAFSTTPIAVRRLTLTPRKWEWFSIGDKKLFMVKAGIYHYSHEYSEGNTPYLGATALDNGVCKLIDLDAEFEANTITVGKINCTTFYQPTPFCATSDVNIIKELGGHVNKFTGLFLASVINFSEGYKWSYGRQCRVNDTESIRIRLPVAADGTPDWKWMEDYIKGLPYSDAL